MIVVDTNVTSELMRASPSPAVATWVRAHSPAELYATSITLAAIGYGIERLANGRRKALLRTAAADVFSVFAKHVLAFDATAAAVRRDRDSPRTCGGADRRLRCTDCRNLPSARCGRGDA